jgi:hypothetical protein
MFWSGEFASSGNYWASGASTCLIVDVNIPWLLKKEPKE